MPHSDHVSSVRNRRVALLVLLLVSIFNYVDRTIISILQVPIKRDLALSDAQLGMMTGLAFALFYSTMGVPIARLADRFNRKYVIVASLALWSAMTALGGFSWSFSSIVFFRIGVALGEAGSIPASHSVIADYYEPARRGTALALWGMALPIGVMLGYLSGGWIAQAIDWRAAMWIIGGTGLLLAPILLALLKEPPRGRFDIGSEVELPGLRQGFAIMLARPSLLFLFAGGALNNFVLSIALNWNAPFYARLHHMSLGEVATALAFMVGLGGGAGILAGGWVTDRIGQKRQARKPIIMALVAMAVCPATLLQVLSPSLEVSLLGSAFAVFFLFFYYSPIIALCLALVPPGIRAFTTSVLLLTVNIVGLGLGPWLAGLLSDTIGGEEGLRVAMAAFSFVAIGAGGCFLLAARTYTRDLSR